MRAWPLSARQTATAVLFVLAIAAGIGAWVLRPKPVEPAFFGPPRSDYALRDYTLIALDEAGKESFRTRGPQLARDPNTGTFALDKPIFTFPQAEGGQWESRAEDGWISAKGDEVRLARGVEVLGAPKPDRSRMKIVSDRMTVYPKADRATSDAVVTVTERGSTMQGRGLEADFATRRFKLLSQSKVRYVPVKR